MAKQTRARVEAEATASIQQPEQVGWANGKYRHTLTKKINVGGEEITELTLREPSTGDVIEAGNPCNFDPAASTPTVRFDEKKLAAMISRLAAIPPSSVAQMSPKDFSALGWILADFFLPM